MTTLIPGSEKLLPLISVLVLRPQDFHSETT
jgi:hypothetical protein